MLTRIFPIAALLSLSFCTYAQTDSLPDQGYIRKFIVYKPGDYSPAKSYPLVINLHGLNSNAAQQQFYSHFDAVADTAKCIVAYPDAVDGSWNFNSSPNDVLFISRLIDHLVTKYPIDEACIFVTGMSMGGFLTYQLACELNDKIRAIAVVSGNMTGLLQIACDMQKPMPLLHIHGTADPLVSYNGAFGIPPAEQTIGWWMSKIHCDTAQKVLSTLPNLDTGDGCTVDKARLPDCDGDAEVVFYRINGGGHTWPGSSIDIPFGNTCQDIDASIEIWRFFRQYCPKTSTTQNFADNDIRVFPNPVGKHVMVDGIDSPRTAQLYDQFSRLVKQVELQAGANRLPMGDLVPGIYQLKLAGISSSFRLLKL